MPRTSPNNSIPIPQIQGRGSLSPYDGTSLKTSGVVTAVQRNESAPGFYLQDPVGDGDPDTSDALFVSVARLGVDALGSITPGKRVEVAGEVREQYQLTTLVVAEGGLRGAPSDKSAATRASIAAATAASLPPAVELDLPASPTQRNFYLEAREGMLATLPNTLVLAPTDRYGTYVAADEKTHSTARDFGLDQDPRHLRISARLGSSRPQVLTGDRMTGVHGPLGYAFGNYELLQTRNYERIQRGPHPPKRWGDVDGDDRIAKSDIQQIKQRVGQPAAGPLDPADLDANGKITRRDANLAIKRSELATGAPSFSIATMNAKDFFDHIDAPPPIDDEVPSRNEYEAKLARISAAIRERVGSPDILAMQEVENAGVLEDLVSRPELQSLGYKYALLPTQGHRSINPALLYRSDRVQVTDVRQVQKLVPLEQAAAGAALGAEAAMVSEALAPGAEGTGSGPLFARQPLLVEATIGAGEAKQDLTVVVNHLISKFSPSGAPTDPIRIEQAKFLNGLVKDLRAADPAREVIVVGDMNDTPDSAALKALRGPKSKPVLRDTLSEHVPPAELYSFNYKGTNQLIDHILVTEGLADRVESAGVRHYNTDLPENLNYGTSAHRATDHDTPYASFRLQPAATADAAAGAAALT